LLVSLILAYLKLCKPKRKKFKVWSGLERLANETQKAVETDINKFPLIVNVYVSTALNLPIKLVRKLPWNISISLYYFSMSLNSPREIPLLKPGSKKDDEVGWDYPGRGWYYWSHLLAEAYGWTLEYIANLDIDDALSYIQEILTTNQLEHEFIWSTTEIAYPYNSTTKQSNFSPLSRPYFMFEKAKPVKIFKIPKAMMPVGVINDVSGMAEVVQKEIESQRTNTRSDGSSIPDD